MNNKNKTSEQLNVEIKSLQSSISKFETSETKFKLVEKALRKTESQQRAILDNIPDIAWLKDKESKFIAVNEAFGRACGVKPEDLVGKTDLDIWPRDLAERYRADDKEVMQSGKRKRVEEPLSDKEGKIQWLETIKTPVFNEKGEVIGTTGIARDITERKHFEERLRETRAELEIRVKVRTAELTKSNEDLRRQIDECQRVENMLKESETRYRAIVEDQTELICRFIPGETITFINDAYCNYFGKSKTELIGKSFMHLIPEEDRKRVEGDFNKISYDNPILVHEHRVVAADGSIRWQQWVNRAIFNNKKEIVEIQAVGRDITESKYMEEALKRGERFLTNIFSSIQDGISILDTDMNIIRVNSTIEKWYLHNMPLIGKKCFEAYHCSKVPCKVCPTQITIKTKTSAYEVVPKRGQNGEIVGWLDLYSFPLIDTDTGEMSGVIEYVRDISERKNAEEALRESEKRNRGLIESQNEFIVRVDTENRFTFVNDAYCKKFGKTREELLGKTFMPLVHEEDLPATLEAMKNLEQPPYRIYVEQRARCTQGWRWIAWEDCAIKDNFGKTVEIQAVGRDITELKDNEKKLEVLNKELLYANTRLKDLSLIDLQTDLYNHRFLSEALEAEFHRARRFAYPLTVIMLDIDYFKSINDVYGHRFGDLVLKQFAKQLKRIVRRYDIVVRFGGEEFVIIFPAADRQQALTLTQRLLDAINLYNFGDKRHSVKLKLSLAVVSFPEDRITKAVDFINLAEQILTKAKESGGNRIYSCLDISALKGRDLKKAETTSDVKVLKRKIDKLTKTANEGLVEAIFAFAKTIELKDNYTGRHVENTVHYATEIANALGLSKEEIELIREAAILHDLGKIGVREKILLKRSKLTKKEFDEIKRHPQIAADILRPIHFLNGLIPFIFYHHERWDGKGYPSGIKGEEIPMGARIIAIADVYQALISDRPYRKALAKNKALEIIKSGAGSQFDPRIVSIFLKILQEEKK